MLATALNLIGWLGANPTLIITLIMFFADYIAEMYDPNPESPGPWFKRHFHRFMEDDNEEE